MNMNDRFKDDPEISCFRDYEDIVNLHKFTLKLWTIIDEWRNQKHALLSRSFLKLNLFEISDFLEETLSFIDTSVK
jgi:hypothetical protein